MKKYLALITLATSLVVQAQLAPPDWTDTNAVPDIVTVTDTNTIPTDPIVPLAPTINVTTNVNVSVQPVHLTKEQMGGIIQAVQATGVQANVTITPTNLSSVYLFEEDGGYTAVIKLK